MCIYQMADAELFSLFSTSRVSSLSPLLCVYFPLGVLIFLIRIFIGFHAFVVACILRKANAARAFVLRVMCGLCGIVVTSSGSRDKSVAMMVSNHVCVLDHLAVDLLCPCVLPSVWDIPNILRWVFGYADLGAREGRDVLITRATQFINTQEYPLLTFPESAMTSGRVGLLQFSLWPFQVADIVQPVAIRVSRPLFDVSPSVLAGAWWQDVAYFLFLPATVIHVHWLPPMEKGRDESVEEFALRVSKAVAGYLGIKTTSYTSNDAVDAAKRHIRARVSRSKPKRTLDARKLDEAAMRIKQSYPAVPVIDIRRDLAVTHDPRTTIERLRNGLITRDQNQPGKSQSLTDPSEWRRLFEERKWNMIEQNRARYLDRREED